MSTQPSLFDDAKVPKLSFVDPYGYKGVTLSLIKALIKDWGSDCIFFFNYNRINMGLSNKRVDDHMNALFGQERAAQVRTLIAGLTSDERELTIINEVAQALKDLGGTYMLPFRFRTEKGSRTSHHLIFVSKHFRGYEIMKDVMAKLSSENNEGVSTFEYNPASIRQPLLYLFRPQPLSELRQALLKSFAGQTLTTLEIYEQHSVDTPFLKKNYKQVLQELEAEGLITVTTRPDKKRKKGSFADHLIVAFPES